MSVLAVADAPSQQTATLLGGRRVLGHQVRSALEAHELLLHGLPSEALLHLLDSFQVLHRTEALGTAVGISLRTVQRRKDMPAKPLNQDQSARTWKFAEILARASATLGSQREAEHWLERPALALDGHRPRDLLATPAGVQLVEDLLQRLEYGVYT